MRNSNKTFPYPILYKDTEDLENSSIEFEYKIVESENLKCIVKVELKNKAIRRLLSKKKAKIITHIDCTKTRYRDTINSYEYDFEFEIPNELLSNRVEIASMIVLTEDLEYTNNDFSDDYKGDIYYLVKNNIIAYGEDITLDIEKLSDTLENLPSIFSIIKDESPDQNTMDLEIQESKIVIKLNNQNYELYKELRNNQKLEQVLATIFIIPALVKVLSDFGKLEEDYSHTNWYFSIKNRLKKLGITDNENISDGALKYSQLILGDTFEKTLEVLETLSLEEEE